VKFSGTDGSYTPPSCLLGGQASHHGMGNHVSLPVSMHQHAALAAKACI
jgi:hypothetical protein